MFDDYVIPQSQLRHRYHHHLSLSTSPHVHSIGSAVVGGGSSQSNDRGQGSEKGPFDQRFTFVLGLIFSLLEGIDLTTSTTSITTTSSSSGGGGGGSSRDTIANATSSSSSSSSSSLRGQGLAHASQGEDSAHTWSLRGLYNPIQLIEKGGIEAFRSFLTRCR